LNEKLEAIKFKAKEDKLFNLLKQIPELKLLSEEEQILMLNDLGQKKL